MFIIIIFWLGCDRPSGLLFFRARFVFFIPTPLLPPSSVSLFYFIRAVPMRKCLGKPSCMSSPFPISILNGTFFFRSVKAMNNWKRSAIKQILLLLHHTLCPKKCIILYYRSNWRLCLQTAFYKFRGPSIDQRELRWLGHMERMDEYRLARRVLMAKVSGGRVRGRPRLGWMFVVKVAFGNRGMTVEVARQCAKDRKEWRALVHM